jgi:prevent-host-death family protein
MHAVNMFEAKSQLSRLIEAIESKQENEIIIARHGRPVAKLVPLDANMDTSQRIGVAKNAFVVPDDIDVSNEEVAALFLGERA